MIKYLNTAVTTSLFLFGFLLGINDLLLVIDPYILVKHPPFFGTILFFIFSAVANILLTVVEKEYEK